MNIIYYILYIFLTFMYISNATLTKSCTGHDGCKNDVWVGSYEITCNGGERNVIIQY